MAYECHPAEESLFPPNAGIPIGELRRPEFRRLLAISITVALGFGMIVPVLPLYARDFGVDLVGLRLTTTYGPGKGARHGFAAFSVEPVLAENVDGNVYFVPLSNSASSFWKSSRWRSESSCGSLASWAVFL